MTGSDASHDNAGVTFEARKRSRRKRNERKKRGESFHDDDEVNDDDNDDMVFAAVLYRGAKGEERGEGELKEGR